MDICIDFDGTCVYHDFPRLGKDAPGAVEVLRELVAHGHRLILFTMRSNRNKRRPTGSPEIQDVTGDFLTHAVNWFNRHEIPLYGIQANPTQRNWTTSPKAYGHLYIDDAALGVPVRSDAGQKRPVVDWAAVRALLQAAEILPTEK